MTTKRRKTCCRSSPRCAGCPVLYARASRAAQTRAVATASLFGEIYGGRTAALPESVSEALVALAHAREPSRVVLRDG